jgi:hypothetical protein
MRSSEIRVGSEVVFPSLGTRMTVETVARDTAVCRRVGSTRLPRRASFSLADLRLAPPSEAGQALSEYDPFVDDADAE